MRSTFRSFVLAIAATAIGTTAFGQLPQTRLYSLFPPGGQAGQTVEVKVTNGADMDEAHDLVFEHPGIKAVQKTNDVNGEQVPVDNTFVVTIDGGVPEGNYEVRLGGHFGYSNPRTFAVGKRPETVESEGNNSFADADETAPGTVVNATANGAADLDYFQFTGKKGQRLVASVHARRIDSKLDPVLEIYDANHRRLRQSRDDVRGDAVADLELPADGQYFLKVYDFAFQGSADHFYRLDLHAGPHVDFVFPPAGKPGSNDEYTVYGRNLPGGQPSGVKLDGVELQKVKTRIKLPNNDAVLELEAPLQPYEAGVDAISWRLETPQGRSNAKLVYLADAPVVAEVEPNDEAKNAQQVTLPVEVAGQFQQRGDVDHVQFEAKAGDVFYVEVVGHRQDGSSADPYLVLEQITKKDDGTETVKRITAQDDFTPPVDNNRVKPTNGAFTWATSDPVYKFVVPADSTYRVQVRDRYFENRGDPSLIYRLCIRPEQPDFRLAAMPIGPVQQRNQPLQSGSIVLRRGENVTVPVMAVKRDGFDGLVDVKAEDLPSGVTAKPAAIGPGDIGTNLVLTAAEDAAVGLGQIRVVGTARIEDPSKTRAIEAAEKELPKLRTEIPKLEQASNKANDEQRKAQEAFDKAKQAAAAKPEDENLKKQQESAQQNLDKANAAAKAATDALEGQRKQVTDTEQRIATLEADREKTARAVTRPARFATLVWQGQNNVSPNEIRLVRSLAVSVIDEVAPYQVTTDVERVEVNQGRQVLVPVKLAKRDGFDNQVNLQFVGIPNNANVQMGNANIEKGKDSQLLRLFVNNNATLGTYNVFLNAQGQVSYKRNPQLVERLKEKQTKLDEMLKAATETKKQADTAKTEADKAAQDAANKLKEAQQKLQQAEQQAKAKPEDAAAKKAAEDAKQAVASAEKANEESAKAKAEAEAKAKQADDTVKSATDAKKKIDTDFKNAENAAKPKNTNVSPPSTSLVLVVKPAPAQLSANVPGGGNLKKGEKLEIKVTVKRVNDFAGPLTLTLPELPNVKGLSAAPVTIPADQTEGTIAITATGDATEGQIPNAVVRATMDFDGKAAVDVPVTIKVAK